MIDSGDSDLLHQKLTMSQYIAFKSEPLGKLGVSGSSAERVRSIILLFFISILTLYHFIALF